MKKNNNYVNIFSRLNVWALACSKFLNSSQNIEKIRKEVTELKTIGIGLEIEKGDFLMTEKGIIKFFNQGGWGFITDNEGKDIFFHKNYLKGYQKEPQTGDQVIFAKELGPRGLRAIWWSFTRGEEIYRILYKRYDNETNFIVSSTGTVDKIIYPKEFKEIKFQMKTESGWEECSDPRRLDKPA